MKKAKQAGVKGLCLRVFSAPTTNSKETDNNHEGQHFVARSGNSRDLRGCYVSITDLLRSLHSAKSDEEGPGVKYSKNMKA